MDRENLMSPNRYGFYFLFALLWGAVFARYAMQMFVPRMLLLLIVSAIAFLGDRDEIIAICMCCIPLHTSFNYLYGLLICILVYAVKYPSDLKINLTTLPVFCLWVWELIHCFDRQVTLRSIIAFCVPYLLCFFLMCSKRKCDYGFIVRVFAVSTVALCVVLLGKLLVAVEFNIDVAFLNMHRLGLDSEAIKDELKITGGEINPNTLGILCVLAMSGLLQTFENGEKKRRDVFWIICLLAFGLLTSSKTFLACLLILVILFVLAREGNTIKKVQTIFVLSVLIIGACILVNIVLPQVMETFLRRLLAEDISSGRINLFALYNEFLFSHPSVLFFGVGVQNFAEKLVMEYSVAANVPHNGFQEVLIAWGIPGLALFLWFLVALVWRGKRIIQRQTILNYIPLIIILAKVQAGQMITSPYTMMAFSFAYLSLCHDFENHDTLSSLEERVNQI